MSPPLTQLSKAGLPLPDAEALKHSKRLTDRIGAEIENAGGSISFRRYMEMVLYEPGLGYYSAGARKFGKEGDFVTAPEWSSLFSYCMATQCAEILQRLDGGVILELGAGSGAMACDIMRELSRIGALPDEYWILETSADLRERQRRLIQSRTPDYTERVYWLDELPESRFRGAIVANEVLDAQPVHRIELRHGQIHELHVAWRAGRFIWKRTPPSPELDAVAARLLSGIADALPEGYRTEINATLHPWLASLADVLEAGVVLLVDYGYPRHEYYHPQRIDGTLQCHYRHRVHSDPFFHPGLQDISAAVDFTAVVEAGLAAGLNLNGFTSQAHFLMGCGLTGILDRLGGPDHRERIELARQARILTLPGEMGEQIKTMALGRNAPAPLRGFATADLRHRLQGPTG
ncbi:MAG: class I SAM-dependent methyltransferase [Gammaproteobacteria bacterium]